MTALVALYASAAVKIDDDFKAVLLFSLGGLVLTFAFLSVNPDALAVLGAY
jgi:hypothetical protein